jgi:virginiamycin B lyase
VGPPPAGPGPAPVVAGTAFDVVVQARDTGGAPRNVSSTTGVMLTAGGAGALGGATRCVIHAGTNSCTVIGARYSAAAAVALTPTRIFGDGWLAARAGAPFTVAAAPAATEYGAGLSGFAGLQDIAAGPDGALWFVEAGIDRIGRIDPVTFAITEYGAGISPGANPRGIAAGPDGAMWFTEYGGNRIGRLDPATGAITEYSAGLSPNAGWQDITAGPDGALWFTEFIGNRIGRIDPATGAITEYASGMSAGANPKGIAAGPDGALWFVEYGANRIGRLDLATRTITETSAGLAGFGGLQDIAAGPDSAMWFTENGANRIGRIDMSRSITEYAGGISGSARPNALAAGPDGALWFTAAGSNRIGRIAPPGARQTGVRLAVAGVNGGAAPAAGAPLNVVVQSVGQDGLPKSVTAGTGVALQVTNGGGSLGGKRSCVIAPGTHSCTVYGATYSRTESGVVLGAARIFGDSWLAAGSSAPITVAPALAATAPNYSDSWWNPNESGWGVTITDHGGNAFVQWYTYDQTGHNQRYVIPGGTFSADKCRFSGAVQRTTGPSWVLPLFDPNQVARAAAGTASFDFCPAGQPAGSAVFAYDVDGVSASKVLTRLPFGNDAPHWGGPATTGGPDFTDLWWNPDESGWGVSITQHGGDAFVRIYTYDTDGRPLLFVAPGAAFNGPYVFSGALQALSGPYFGSIPFDPNKVVRTTVGSATLSFGDADRGVLTYTVNGITRSKTITRLPF